MKTWDLFIRSLENFFTLNDIKKNTESMTKRKELLIYAMGTKTLQLFCNLTSVTGDNVLARN